MKSEIKTNINICKDEIKIEVQNNKRNEMVQIKIENEIRYRIKCKSRK